MRSSYNPEEVTLLLKDISGLVTPQSTTEREAEIQAGRHYSEMLPLEYSPSAAYMEAYEKALENYSKATADAVAVLADKIIKSRGKTVVLVSLARAGIPIGILLRRYIAKKYYVNVFHYSISIIRGRGIDKNAMAYILERHEAKDILFVDGWTGKGAILGELEKEIAMYPDVSPELAVVSDPANIATYCGTHEDILIASSCLNSTVSGLISRTFLRDDIISDSDFHGAVYYEKLESEDLSEQFLSAIERHFNFDVVDSDFTLSSTGLEEVREISEVFSIADINLIKPSIGECTRVLLRRVPWKVLISENHKNDAALEHIIRLAKEKGVPIEYYPLKNYRACGLIKNLADA